MNENVTLLRADELIFGVQFISGSTAESAQNGKCHQDDFFVLLKRPNSDNASFRNSNLFFTRHEFRSRNNTKNSI